MMIEPKGVGESKDDMGVVRRDRIPNLTFYDERGTKGVMLLRSY